MGKMPLCYYLLPWENRGYTMYCLLLSVGTLQRSGIKLLIENLTRVPIIEFYTRLGIWNCTSVWSTDKFIRKLMLLRKNESSLEKNNFTEQCFSSKSKSSNKKESLQDEESDTKFTYQMLPWILCKVT